MRETITAARAQEAARKIPLKNQLSSPDDFRGTYYKLNADPVAYHTITITKEDGPGALFHFSVELDSDTTLDSLAALYSDPVEALSFQSVDGKQFFYAMLCTLPHPTDNNNKYLLAYSLEYSEALEKDPANPMGDPTATGIWLGTSNPPPPIPCT